MTTREDEIEALAIKLAWPRYCETKDRDTKGEAPRESHMAAAVDDAAQFIATAKAFFATRTSPAEQPAQEAKRCYHLLELANALESDVELGWPVLIAKVQRLRKESKHLPQPEQPALPTDRMGWLELWLRCSKEIGVDVCAYRAEPDQRSFTNIINGFDYPRLTESEITRLQALAAELLAKDGRDGS